MCNTGRGMFFFPLFRPVPYGFSPPINCMYFQYERQDFRGHDMSYCHRRVTFSITYLQRDANIVIKG